MRAGQGGQLLRCVRPAEVMEYRGAVVEQDRVDALHPGSVLAAQVMVGLQQRPVLQDLLWRDPAFRPTRMLNGPGRGEFRIRDRYPAPGLTRIARADVARFMIGALTEQDYIRQAPAICW